MAYNWTIQQAHFPTFTPILDFVHVVEHICAAVRHVRNDKEELWQLLQFARAGLGQQNEGRPGVIFDVSARGDSQNHVQYAKHIFGWGLSCVAGQERVDLGDFFADGRNCGDYLHVFDYHGRRVTKQDLDWDEWRNWQAELNAKLQSAIAFLYGNFVRGTRRIVFDGVEPVDRPNESIQLNLLEYVYHQVVRKDSEWVARDLFRQDYRKNAEAAARHNYDPAHIGCMLLSTSHDAMLRARARHHEA